MKQKAMRGSWISNGSLVVLSAPVETEPSLDGLTPAEGQVARLVARGLTNAEIAQRRKVSAGTIAKQIEAIYRKLGVRSRRALVKLLS